MQHEESRTRSGTRRRTRWHPLPPQPAVAEQNPEVEQVDSYELCRASWAVRNAIANACAGRGSKFFDPFCRFVTRLLVSGLGLRGRVMAARTLSSVRQSDTPPAPDYRRASPKQPGQYIGRRPRLAVEYRGGGRGESPPRGRSQSIQAVLAGGLLVSLLLGRFARSVPLGPSDEPRK